jgi:dipeptidyl-peptidase 4
MRRLALLLGFALLVVVQTVHARQAARPGTAARPSAAATTAVAPSPMAVQHGLPERLDARLRAIFERNEYGAEGFGPMAWLDGGRRYTVLTRGQTRDIAAIDTATGRSETLVAASALVPKGHTAPLSIAAYAWSADRTKLLVFTNTGRVWRQHTRGDYWVLDRASGVLTKLGGDAPAGSLMFAKFSPDGTRVAYVRAQNLQVEDLTTGTIRALTTDGGGDVINGTSDWVNEEEFSIRDGFRWSPNGRRIAYWQFNTAGVERFTLINDTDALYPTTTVYPYPKPGTTNSAVRIGIVEVETGVTTWVKAEGDARQHYVPHLAWADASTVVLQQMNRLQNRNDLLLAQASTGDVRRLARDQSATWVDTADPIVPISSELEFTWVSETDGWRHLYAINRADGRMRLITDFAGDILGVDAIDAAGDRAYVTASPDSAIGRYLYSVTLGGTGRLVRVTPANQPGTHTYNISPDSKWAVHTWSRFETPPRIEIVSLPDHRVVRTITDNSALAARVAPLLTPPAEFLTVSVGEGVTLDGWLIRPRGFNPARKYPVLVQVYGEPASTTVADRWGGPTLLFHRALADEGYVVVSFDNRGTPAPKGAAWRKVVYGTVGELSAREQAAAIKALAASRPYVDAGRVAIWGWSGGGSNTLNAMFRYPDVYQVGIAVAPVPDQRLYDTIYQERYMGLPAENASGYRAGSPINFAEGLRGRLLIVHGTGDDNVHYQGVERLINRLVELGKRFDVMIYPNRSHGISEGPGTSLHLRRLIARYLLEQLPPAR